MATIGATLSTAIAALVFGRPFAGLPAASAIVGEAARTSWSEPTPEPPDAVTRYWPGLPSADTDETAYPLSEPVVTSEKLSKPPLGSVSMPITASLNVTVKASEDAFV